MPAYFWQTKLEEVAIARAQDTVVNLELLGKLIAQQGRDFVEKNLPFLSDVLSWEKLTHKKSDQFTKLPFLKNKIDQNTKMYFLDNFV